MSVFGVIRATEAGLGRALGASGSGRWRRSSWSACVHLVRNVTGDSGSKALSIWSKRAEIRRRPISVGIAAQLTEDICAVWRKGGSKGGAAGRTGRGGSTRGCGGVRVGWVGLGQKRCLRIAGSTRKYCHKAPTSCLEPASPVNLPGAFELECLSQTNKSTPCQTNAAITVRDSRNGSL